MFIIGGALNDADTQNKKQTKQSYTRLIILNDSFFFYTLSNYIKGKLSDSTTLLVEVFF